MGKKELRNRNFFNCLLFPCVHFFHIILTFFHMFETHFFTFFPSAFSKCMFPFFSQTCEKMWEMWKMWKNTFWKCVLKMHLGKKTWKNVKNTFEHPVGKVELWFFRDQFCCSYFAACPTSAGWKSERSSSNRSEVDCADRRSVQYIYSKEMTTRSKNIKSNAKEKEQNFKVA